MIFGIVYFLVVFQIPVVTGCKHMAGIAEYRDRNPGCDVNTGFPHNPTGNHNPEIGDNTLLLSSSQIIPRSYSSAKAELFD